MLYIINNLYYTISLYQAINIPKSESSTSLQDFNEQYTAKVTSNTNNNTNNTNNTTNNSSNSNNNTAANPFLVMFAILEKFLKNTPQIEE